MKPLSRLIALAKLGERVLLVGPPGLAKTSLAIAVGRAVGRRVIIMRASLSERVDFGGALVPDVKSGVTRALPLELLAELRKTKEAILLVLDDLGQAPIDVQAALMRLFDGDELSSSVLIWGATNRPKDKAGVSALCEPLRSRFSVAFAMAVPGDDGDERPDGAVRLSSWSDAVDEWLDWARLNGAAPEILAWIGCTANRKTETGAPDSPLYKWSPSADPALRMADFRSWATVIRLWNGGLRDLSTIGAAIGKPAAAELLAFVEFGKNVPTPATVKKDPDGAPIPVDPQALFLTCSIMAAAAETSDASGVNAIVRYMTRLPRVYSALLAQDLYKRLGKEKLRGSAVWSKWFVENSALFSARS